MNRRLISLSCACSWLALATAAQAAEPSEAADARTATVTEIIVTANKREERLQDVPMSVTAIGAEQLAGQAIHSTDDLVKALPALTNNPASGAAVGLVIRGVGTVAYSKSSEGSVGIVVDGVALGTAASPLGATALFDVARVELLEGPQGTLFGRNASAGVLNIVSNAPVIGRFEGVVHADIATRDNQVFQGVLNAPLGETAAMRVSGYWNNAPEVYTNALSGDRSSFKSQGGRARLLWRPTSNLTVNIIGDYDDSRSSGNFSAYIDTTPGSYVSQKLSACGVTPSSRNSTNCTDGPIWSAFKTYGVSAQADYALGEYTLTSVTANRWQTGSSNADSDGLPVDLLNVVRNAFDVDNFSQEIRLTSPAGERLEYVAGLYYANANRGVVWDAMGSFSPGLLAAGLKGGSHADYQVNNKSYAAFFQGTFHLTDALRLNAGARWDRERVAENSAAPTRPPGTAFPLVSYLPINATVSDTDLSYRFGAQYDVAQNIMLYASYARGYKGPAFNELPTNPTMSIVIKPEIPKQFELGAKTSLFENRLAVNLALFDTDVTNFQTNSFDPATNLTSFTNVPSLKTRGVELNLFGSPLAGLTVNGGVAYVDAYYGEGYFTTCGPTQGTALGCDPVTKTQSAAGRRATLTPRWKATLNGQYEWALSDRLQGFVQADAVYTSSVTYVANYDPASSIGDYLLLGARVGLKTSDGRYGISVFGRNLTDQRLPVYRVSSSLFDPGGHTQLLGSDSFRRFGVTLDAKF